MFTDKFQYLNIGENWHINSMTTQNLKYFLPYSDLERTALKGKFLDTGHIGHEAEGLATGRVFWEGHDESDAPQGIS